MNKIVEKIHLLHLTKSILTNMSIWFNPQIPALKVHYKHLFLYHSILKETFC